MLSDMEMNNMNDFMIVYVSLIQSHVLDRSCQHWLYHEQQTGALSFRVRYQYSDWSYMCWYLQYEVGMVLSRS